jgi:hypothetical protein
MERSIWTDERLNDMASTVDRNVSLLGQEVRALREETASEFRALRQETSSEFRALRADLSAWQRQIARIGWAFATGLLATLAAALIAAL